MATAMQIGPRTESLDASEALAAAGAAAWRWDIGSPVVEWSAGASEVLGVPEIVLRSPELLREAVDPADLELLRAAADSWRDHQMIAAQVRVRLDGEARWFDVAGRVIVSVDAAPHYATGTARDVTEAREAQDALLDALHESEAALEHLHALFDGGVPALRGRVA